MQPAEIVDAAETAALSFVRVDGKIRFRANPVAIDRAGLKVSAQLLKLAVVADGPVDEE